MIKHILRLLLIAMALAPTAHAQTLSKAQLQNIDAYLAERIDSLDPGIAVGVVWNGNIVLEKYVGYASLQHKVPVTKDSRFNIASVAKQFTALMVLDLVIKGKLSLDDDIRTWVPELYPDIDHPILLRQVINHSSGIRDYPDLMSIQRNAWWRRISLDNDDVLEFLASQTELNFEPGTDDEYSNSNYTILTKIIESVSGQKFHQHSDSVFKSLGMNQTVFNKSYMGLIPDIALPYSDWGNGAWTQYPHMTDLYGDGFLYTTLPDQLTFEVALQNAKESENELLQTSQKPIEGANITTYGFGLEFEERQGRPVVYHSGATGSYHAQALRFPEEKLSIFVMSNNSHLWSGYVAEFVASQILPEKEANPAETVDYLGSADYSKEIPLSSILGVYKNSAGRLIRIKQDEGKVFWQEADYNPIQIERDSGSLYQSSRTNTTKIGFTATNFSLYVGNSKPGVYERLPDFTPNDNYLKALEGAYRNDELDVVFRLELNEKGELIYHQEKLRRSRPINLLYKDDFTAAGYRIRVKRTAGGQVDTMLLTANRAKNVTFVKVED